jgi:hypothetical protein
MQYLEESNSIIDDASFTSQLKDKHAKMLAFLYNIEHQIAAERFDQRFAQYS